MDPRNKNFKQQLTELLEKQEKERKELQKKSDEDKSDVTEDQFDDLSKRHQDEIEELNLQFQVVENVVEGSSTKSLVLTALALIFATIALVGFGYLKGEQSILVSNVENNAQLNVATSVIAKSAIDGVKTVKAEVERVEKIANDALATGDALTPRVDALELYNTEVVAPTISTFNAKFISLNKKDIELKKAIALVDKTLGKDKAALAERDKAREAKYTEQKELNALVSDQIIAMKKENAIIRKNQGMIFRQIWDLTYAECNDIRRSKGYGKKECLDKLIYLKSLFPQEEVKAEKGTALYFLILEITTPKK